MRQLHMQIQLVSRLNTKAMLPGWGGGGVMMKRILYASVGEECWQTHTHDSVLVYSEHSRNSTPTSWGRCSPPHMTSVWLTAVRAVVEEQWCLPSPCIHSFYLVTVLKCDNMKSAQTAGERIPICFFTLSHCFPPSFLFAFTFMLLIWSGRQSLEGERLQMSYRWCVWISVQIVQSPAAHQRVDAEWDWLAAVCGLGRVTELLLLVSGLTVRPQGWGILIIYLIVRMCWLINLSWICRINYPIIPL